MTTRDLNIQVTHDGDVTTVVHDGRSITLSGDVARQVRADVDLYRDEPPVATSAFWRGFLRATEILNQPQP